MTHKPTGIKARVPKGTLVGGRLHLRRAGKTYTVTVDHLLNGYVAQTSYDASKRIGHPTIIRWNGKNGWNEAALADVEIVEGEDLVAAAAQLDKYPLVTRADVEAAIIRHRYNR